MKINRKDKIIIGLFAVAVILFCVIWFGVMPAVRAKEAAYAKNQTDALTHDICAIENFKSPYIGDASNVSNLFYHLPLCDIPMKFQIDSKNCSVTVSYSDTILNIGEEKAHRDTVYNAVAAMASIDNLSAITYEFPGDSFSFTRTQIEKMFGAPLSSLLKKEVWAEKVQNQISSEMYQ